MSTSKGDLYTVLGAAIESKLLLPRMIVAVLWLRKMLHEPDRAIFDQRQGELL